MGQWLRTLDGLAADMGLRPITYMVAYDPA